MEVVLLKPEEVTIKDLDGIDKHFKIHRLPAIEGRKIAYQFLNSNMPGIGDYKLSKELSDLMMRYVTVKIGEEGSEKEQPLTSDLLINNHVGDWEVLSKLEDLMFAHNTSFLVDGKASIFRTMADQMLRYALTRLSTPLSEL